MLSLNHNIWLQKENRNEIATGLIEKIHSSNPLKNIYYDFNGEKSYGSWRPGFHFPSLQSILELIDATSDAWEWEEEETGQPYFMTGFFPFIHTSTKTSIGILCFAGSSYDDNILEYDYESGDIRIWSTSSKDFFEAFFCEEFLSLYKAEIQLASLYQPHEFTCKEKEILSKWVGIRFPVVDSPFIRKNQP